MGPIPEPPADDKQLGLRLRKFMSVEEYLTTGNLDSKALDALPSSLRSVLHEDFMSRLSESFSKSSHEGDYEQAAESGVTLLALYLLIYPKNYPQIGIVVI